MSVAGELEPPTTKRGTAMQATAKRAGSRRHWLLSNAEEWFALIGRAPRTVAMRPAWRAPARLALGGLVAIVSVAGSMVLLDAATITAVGGLPDWVIGLFNTLTDFGTSDWFLVPIALVLLASRAWRRRRSRR